MTTINLGKNQKRKKFIGLDRDDFEFRKKQITNDLSRNYIHGILDGMMELSEDLLDYIDNKDLFNELKEFSERLQKMRKEI